MAQPKPNYRRKLHPVCPVPGHTAVQQWHLEKRLRVYAAELRGWLRNRGGTPTDDGTVDLARVE